MKLIVGLGNPGQEYENTRHNLGFMAVDFLHADNFSPWKLAHGAYTARGEFNGVKCMLVKPQSYMNLSGRAVQELAAWYKAAPSDIVVLHDELDLPLGEVRVKIGGGAAGHNGIKDIVEKLGTPEFWRVRIGMATEKVGGGYSYGEASLPADVFVLKPFRTEEKALVREGIEKALHELPKLLVEKST